MNNNDIIPSDNNFHRNKTQDLSSKEIATKDYLRIVVTFTTLPDRYDVLRKTLQAIKEQDIKIDAIYLTVPKRARRLNKEYPPIPNDIATICNVIYIDTDYGPITKLYGALISESDPNTIIISCDDDVIHKPNIVSVLVKHSNKFPKVAICGTGALISKGLPLISIVSSLSPFKPWNGLTGFQIGKQGRAVDLIFGVAGVLYRRGFFPPNDKLEEELLQYSLKDDSIFLNDDVLISGYLSKIGIKKLVFYDIPTVECQGNREDALSYDIAGMIFKLHHSINKVKEFGFFPTMEELPYDETVAWRVVVSLIIIVIIIILCVFLYKTLSHTELEIF